MLVTLYCDASFDPNAKVGGWGVWLRCDSGRLVRGGVCPAYVTESADAELAAIYAGVHLAVATWSPAVQAIMVRSDCQQALGIITGQIIPRREGAVRLTKKIGEAVRAVPGLRLIPRWVKGHQVGEAVDAFLNRQVDAIAYQHMARERKQARDRRPWMQALRAEQIAKREDDDGGA